MLTRKEFLRNLLGLVSSYVCCSSELLADDHSEKRKFVEFLLAKSREFSEKEGVKSLTILYPEGCLHNIRAVSEPYSQATGIEIKFKQVGVDDINTQMLLDSIQEKSDYDIALPATFGLPDLVESGALLNLNDLATQYELPVFRKGNLYSIGDYYKSNRYGYQTDGDAYLMFYKKSWLDDSDNQKRFQDKYERDLRVPQTWEELDQTMKFFHDPTQGKYGGCLFRTSNYMAWEWWIRFHAKGYYPVDDQMVPQINNSGGVAALEELIEASGYLHPSSTVNGLFDNWKIFSEGNCFCNIGWGGTQKFLNSNRSKVKGDLIFSPTPGGRVKGKLIEMSYFNWGWNYVVSAFSKKKELSYLFSLYACSPTVSTQAVQEADGYFDPFREEHYQDSKIQKIYSKDFLEAHRIGMKNSIPDFYLKGQGKYFNALKENIYLAVTKKLSAQEALNIAAQEWDRITESCGKKGQIKQWEFLKGRYPLNAKKALV